MNTQYRDRAETGDQWANICLEYQLGWERGRAEGLDEECEQDFAFKHDAYVEGYWDGWRNVRAEAARSASIKPEKHT